MAIMGAGVALIAVGSLALVGFVALPEGPRRSNWAGLAFRAIGVGLGSVWASYGVLAVTGPALGVSSLLWGLLGLVGVTIVWRSVRTRRPLG